MKTLAVAAALLALLVLPAEAQLGSSSKRSHPGDKLKFDEEQTYKVDEKAYKEALKHVPDPKEKYDPWSGARPATPGQKQSK